MLQLVRTSALFYVLRCSKPSTGVQKLLRKEVIHPHLPVGIPCYDLVLIADLTLVPDKQGLRVLPTLLA